MDRKTAEEFVVKELGKHHSRNEIIVALCEATSLGWKEAELFVQEVEARNSREISARQSPLIIALGLGLILAGLALTYYSASFFYDYFLSPHTGLTVENALSIRTVIYRTVSLITGVSMIIGGLMGSWKSLAGMLNE